MIFLDEPTTGLDPRSRRTMWDTVRSLVAGGTTVFLTTQYLEEADQLADRIAVLDGGRIVAEGTADELKAQIPGSHVRLRFTDSVEYALAVAAFPGATCDEENLALRVAGDGGLDALRALLDRLDAAGIQAADFSVHTPRPRRRVPRPDRRRQHRYVPPREGDPAMSTLTYAVHDSMTMLRRNLKHAIRYPSVSLGSAMMPILMLLLFVYAFGDSMGAGLPGGGGRDAYLEYLTPGVIIMGVAAGAMSTSIAVCSDMTEGIINRFRTMNITRSSFMTGHVIGSVIQTMVSLVLVVGVALALGFRSDASAVDWLAAVGLIAAIAFAVTWLSAALGLISKTVESASNKPLLVQFLPFLGSAFVPSRLDVPGPALVRRVPAVHADDRDAARTAHRHGDRQQRLDLARLVRRHRPGRLRLVALPLQQHHQALRAHLSASSDLVQRHSGGPDARGGPLLVAVRRHSPGGIARRRVGSR
ncbi:hypothetical protein GCM10020000_78080 [Streptomyces olivoverticillatus]